MTTPGTPRSGASAAYVLAGLSVLLGALGQVLIKAGVTDLGQTSALATLSEGILRPTVLAGLAAYALSAALWLAVLSRLPLSAAYPLGSAVYVIVVVAARSMGEQIPPVRWLGVVLIVAGIVLVGLRSGPTPDEEIAERLSADGEGETA